MFASTINLIIMRFTVTRGISIVCCWLLLFSAHAQPAPLKPGNNKFEKGKLEGSRRIGAWQYFDSKGTPELTFDYDSSRIVYAKPDTNTYWLKVDTAWQLVRPTRAPRLLGSREHDLERISRELRYPVAALRTQTQGDVLISYVVGPNGQAQDFIVEQGLSPECDQATWQALRNYFTAWIPAVYQGKVVPARFYFLATFRITEGKAAATTVSSAEASREQELAKSKHYLDHITITVIGVTRTITRLR